MDGLSNGCDRPAARGRRSTLDGGRGPAEEPMTLTMRRVVLFTKDMTRMIAFYRDVLGLPLRLDEPGYKEFDAGGCGIALHNGTSRPGARPPKLVFRAGDVAAVRAELAARGARLGKVLGNAGLQRCEGKDPDGNSYSISNRA